MNDGLSSVLPSHSTLIEKALEAAFIWVAESAPMPAHWDADACPADLLPFLAASLSVDDWNPDWSDDRKRAVIKASIPIHRRKGTIGSVRRAIQAFGFGNPVIVEGRAVIQHDGAHQYDGTQSHGEIENWARYRVYLSQPITADQAARLRRILASVAPARCELVELNFTEAPLSYDGSATHDGTFTHGSA